MAWRERRRKLLLKIQAHIAHVGCMDVLQDLDVCLQSLSSGPPPHCAASAAHACSAVEAVSALDARYSYTVLLLLHLVVALGSADGAPLQTHQLARVQALIGSCRAKAVSAATVRFLSDEWGGATAPTAAPTAATVATAARAGEPSLEALQISDARMEAGVPVDTGATAAVLAGRRSLLRALSKPDAAEVHRTVAGADATKVVLQLIKHGALWPLEALSRLLASRAAACDSVDVEPCTLFTRGVCALGAQPTSKTTNTSTSARAHTEGTPLGLYDGATNVSAAAVGMLCSALDHALLLHTVDAADAKGPRPPRIETVVEF